MFYKGLTLHRTGLIFFVAALANEAVWSSGCPLEGDIRRLRMVTVDIASINVSRVQTVSTRINLGGSAADLFLPARKTAETRSKLSSTSTVLAPASCGRADKRYPTGALLNEIGLTPD
jgi:hypothetical protein